MRLALVLPALLLALACKSDPGDEAGESSTGTGGCSAAGVGDLEPTYPACSCDYQCEDGAECRFTAMSSICEPQCTDSTDCPPLGGLPATCGGGHCFIPCNEQKACPSGYVCIENVQCQAER